MSQSRPLLGEFWTFAVLEARACLFAGAFFVALGISAALGPHLAPYGLYRYDLLFIFAVGFQWWMVRRGLETWDEVKTLAVFHVLGLLLEIFKTSASVHSWSYPEAGWLKISQVPLYSGFMYAAIGSYVCQAWRLMHLRVEAYPSRWLSVPLLTAIYLNFFTEHFIGDLRWWLCALVIVVFWRTRVHFCPTLRERSMPLALSFVLIGFFVWIAENIGTFLHGWQYPTQAGGWTMVHLSKVTSWGLLVIISVMLVAELKRLKSQLHSAVEPMHADTLPSPTPLTDKIN